MPKAQQAVEIFGNRLREARELRGLSQRELAERLGMQPSSIAHFEGNRRKPSLENLRRLSGALDVTADFLLGRANEPISMPQDDHIIRDLTKLSSDDRDLIAAMLKVLLTRKRASRQS